MSQPWESRPCPSRLPRENEVAPLGLQPREGMEAAAARALSKTSADGRKRVPASREDGLELSLWHLLHHKAGRLQEQPQGGGCGEGEHFTGGSSNLFANIQNTSFFWFSFSNPPPHVAGFQNCTTKQAAEGFSLQDM